MWYEIVVTDSSSSRTFLCYFVFELGGEKKLEKGESFSFSLPPSPLTRGTTWYIDLFFPVRRGGMEDGRVLPFISLEKKKKKKGKKVLFSVIFIFGRYTVLHFQHRHIFPYATFLLNNNTSILQSSTLLCRFFRNKRSPLPTLPSLASPSRWVF